MMPAGRSWVAAAIDDVAQALRLEPANARAAELLAALALETIPARDPAAAERESDHINSTEDVSPAIVQRLASLTYRAVDLGVREPGVFRACTSLMLDAGDVATAHDCSVRALAAGSDSTWHLLRLTWLAILHVDTMSAKRFLSAALRSAHDPASRAELGWHFEDPCQPRDACTPIGLLGFRLPTADKLQWLSLPDSLADRWFAAQLAGVARGDTDAYWRGDRGSYTQSAPPLRGSRDWSVLVRHLAAHFTSVSYAGGTFRACVVTTVPVLPCAAAIERHGEAPIDVVAQLDRLWDPATGEPIDLVPYAVIGNDLATVSNRGNRIALMRLNFRTWGSAGERDTTLRLSLVLPTHAAKYPAYTGYVVFQMVPGLDAWSLMATQDEGRYGGVYQDDKSPLDAGPLALSDLVLGVASEGLVWTVGDRRVALAPQDVVPRDESVHLYYQVRSASDRARVRTTITVFPEGADRATTVPAMQIGFEGSIHRGLNEADREVVLSHLGRGRYLFSVEVDDSEAHVTSRRSVLMTLK